MLILGVSLGGSGDEVKHFLGSALWGGGSGDEAPRTPKNFRKCSKNFVRKLLKMHYFSKFFKKFNKAWVTCSRVWTKNTVCWKSFRKFSKIFSKFLKKIAKMHYFSIFSKHLTKHALILRGFGRKMQIVWKFW